MTGSTAESDLRGDTRRARVLLKSDSGSEWKFAASRNRSYTTLFSYQWRQKNKAKLACLASEYQFWFCSSLCLYTSICAFPGNGAKNACWRLPTSPPGKQRWRPQTPILGGSISWTTNESAGAQNTTVAFYPGVYQGVFYISAGKTAVESAKAS